MSAKKLKRSNGMPIIKADLPHLRDGGGWKSSQAKPRMESYILKLLSMGMDDADAQCMMADLYWDCYEELVANGHGEDAERVDNLLAVITDLTLENKKLKEAGL